MVCGSLTATQLANGVQIVNRHSLPATTEVACDRHLTHGFTKHTARAPVDRFFQSSNTTLKRCLMRATPIPK